jgi:hypothetical protein
MICDQRLVDAQCRELKGARWPAGAHLRLAGQCVAHGGGFEESLRIPKPIDFVNIEVRRDGCAVPEPIEFEAAARKCAGQSVAVANDLLGPGTYRIHAWKSFTFRIPGKPGACPSEEEHQDWLRRRKVERQRLEKLADERRRELERLAVEELRRECTPPFRWSPESGCRPAPAPAPAPAPVLIVASPPAPATAPASPAAPAPAPPSLPASGFWSSPNWRDDRATWGWKLSMGATANTSRHSTEADFQRGWVGGTLAGGFRHFGRYDGEPLIGGTDHHDGMRWCMPVLCFIGGLLVAPKSSFLGNELGLDVRVHLGRDFLPGSDELGAGVSLRPILRTSPDSRFATGTLVGTWLPEVGVRFPIEGPTELVLGWGFFPIDFRIGRYLALSWDGPVVGPIIPLDGGPVRTSVGTGLTVDLLGVGP